MRTTRNTSLPHFLSRALATGAAATLALSLAGCKSDSSPAPIITNNSAAANPNGPDPADANIAGSAGQTTQVMGQSQTYTPQQQGQSYASGQQAPAPVVQGYSNNSTSNEAYATAQNYSGQNSSGQAGYDQGYSDGESAEAASAPPPLPIYDQPAAPDPNDIWTPGYWNYASTGYYWVPGTWVAAPYYGALWTPPYWGYAGNRYRFHRGYWGPHIGYYGGINYGFGYIGIGYYGGYWRGHDFYYNRSVNRVGPSFRTVYERPVIVNNIRYDIHPTTRISYNGGPGGVNAQPRAFEQAAERERHEGPLPAQMALRQAAFSNRGNFFAQNQGRPAQVAFAHPPNAPVAQPGGNAVQPFNRGGVSPGAQPFNRPGAPGFGANPGGRENAQNATNVPHGFSGAPGNRPAEAGNPGFNRPGIVGNRPTESGSPGLIRPGVPAQPTSRPGAPGGAPGLNRPNEAGGRPSGFNTPNFNRPANAPSPSPVVGNRPGPNPAVSQPLPVQPHVQGGGNPGFNRPGGEVNPGFHRSGPVAPAGNPGFSRPAPVPARAPQHMETPRPAPAPVQHIEAPRAAPVPAPAPHVDAPRGAPGGGGPGGGAPGGGGHPGGGHPGGEGRPGPR